MNRTYLKGFVELHLNTLGHTTKNINFNLIYIEYIKKIK
jgi:hypothetical protein